MLEKTLCENSSEAPLVSLDCFYGDQLVQFTHSLSLVADRSGEALP